MSTPGYASPTRASSLRAKPPVQTRSASMPSTRRPAISHTRPTRTVSASARLQTKRGQFEQNLTGALNEILRLENRLIDRKMSKGDTKTKMGCQPVKVEVKPKVDLLPPRTMSGYHRYWKKAIAAFEKASAEAREEKEIARNEQMSAVHLSSDRVTSITFHATNARHEQMSAVHLPTERVASIVACARDEQMSACYLSAERIASITACARNEQMSPVQPSQPSLPSVAARTRRPQGMPTTVSASRASTTRATSISAASTTLCIDCQADTQCWLHGKRAEFQRQFKVDLSLNGTGLRLAHRGFNRIPRTTEFTTEVQPVHHYSRFGTPEPANYPDLNLRRPKARQQRY
jgi:hypothetical protein